MAPALTQDSQPELLLPYFTPPYTPSPPSSVGGATTNASSVLHHHHYHHYHGNNNISIRGCGDATGNTTNDENHHHSSSVSCSNMEDGPSGGLDDQHLHLHRHALARENSIKGREAVIILEQQEDESSAHHHKAHHHHHHHHHHLDQGDDDEAKFKLDDLDDSSRSIAFNQPTPPHSTDSSAPLSPLLNAKGTHPHLLDGEPSPQCAEEELSPHSTGNRSPTLQTTDNDSPAHQTTDNDSPAHQTTDNDSPTHQITDNDFPVHQTTDDSPAHQSTDNQSPDHQTTENASPAHQTTENASPAHQTTDNQSPDHQTTENESPPHKTTKNESPAHQTTDNQSPSHYTTDDKSLVHQTSDNKSPDHLFSDKSPAEQSTEDKSLSDQPTDKSATFLSLTSQTSSGKTFYATSFHHRLETAEESNSLGDKDRSSTALHNPVDDPTRLPSPHTTARRTQPPGRANTCNLTSARDTEQQGVPVTATKTLVPVHSSEDLSSCRAPTLTTATLAPTPHLVGSPRGVIGDVVRPLLGSTTATTIVVSPPSFSSPLGGGLSSDHQVVAAAMGCTLPQVETKVAVRCPAPQPNDTPPPAAAYLPKTSSVMTTDLNYDGLIPNLLPSDIFMTLNNLVSINPGLLDQLNPNGSNLTAVSSTATSLSTSSPLSASSVGSVSRVPLLPEASSLTSNIGPATSAVSGGASQGVTPDQQASCLVSALTLRQLRLQKKQTRVLRRLRRFTGRGLAAGISQQLRGLTQHLPGLVLGDVKQDPGAPASVGGEEVTTAAASVDHPQVSSSRDVLQPPRYDTTALKSMSTAKLITYVRRMETRSCASSTVTGTTSSANTDSCTATKSISDSVTSQRRHEDDVSRGGPLEWLPGRVRSELSSVASEMSACARLHVEHDSDATESSSGGESCDEMEGFDDDLHTDSKPIACRALYRFASERARIATRWTWLEAQLADVECKIHQHNRAQMRLRHLSRSTASKTDLPCHHGHHHQTPPPPPSGSAAPAINPATLSRPSYTCLTRSTQHHLNTSNSLHQSIATHNANTNGSTFNATTTTNNSSGGGGNHSSSCLPGAADASSPVAGPPTVSSCCGDSGSARTSGYRWHRKRRWIRVGHVFERGDACSSSSSNLGGDRKDSVKRIKTSHYSSSATTPSTTNTNINNFVHNKNSLTNIKIDECGGNSFNNKNSVVDKKVGLLDGVVRQPTFAVSCECVPPYSCVLCTRLPSKGAIVSAALLGDRTSLGTNCSNNKNFGNKLFPHHHNTPLKLKPPSSPAGAASANAAFSPSPRHHTHSLSPHQPSLSPLKSLTPSWTAQDTTPSAKPSLLFSRQHRLAVAGVRGTESLCKSAWFPRVPSSSRTCLNTQSRHVPLPERLGQHDFAFHPVLSHPSEILQSTRLETVLKSKSWMKKLSSLQNPCSLHCQRQASSVSSSQQSRLSAHTTSRSSPYTGSVPLSGGGGSSATTSSSQYGSAGTDASARLAPPLGDATDQPEAHHHRSSSSSHSKKKKKNKDRDRSREGRRKDKKKKAYKRKEKEAKKGRLTLRLRKSSVTGEMVPTGDAPCILDKTHHYLIEGGSNTSDSRSSGRGGSGHLIPPPLSLCGDGDSSSLYSSSRASSPSLPPHSPAATLSDHGHHHHRGAYGSGDAKGAAATSSGGGGANNNNNNKYNKGASSHDKPSKTVTYSDKVTRAGSAMDADGGGASEAAMAGVSTSVSSSVYATRRSSMFASASGSGSSVVGGAGSGSTSAAVTAASQQPLTPAAADAMAFKKKQGTAPYDIDNIVIPYNMATVTRVEPIEYKEIITPKWSEVEEPEPLDVRDPVEDEEDVSEPAVLARHLRSEELERLRFAAHMSTGGTRHGGNARTRQRNAMGAVTAAGGTSSAGTNTPDNPLSPHVDVAELASPMISPPSTPLPLSEDSNQSSSSGAPKPHTASGLAGGSASSETAFPEEEATRAADGDEATDAAADKPAPPTTEPTSTHTTSETPVTSASVAVSQKSSVMKSVTHNAPIVISSPFLANLCNKTEAATACDDGIMDMTDATNLMEVAGEQIIPSSASSVGSTDAANAKAANSNVSSAAAASRRLRSNSSGLRPRSGSSGTAANQPAEDEHNSREVSPFPMRQFPLCESQYDSMLRENSEASVHPVPAAAHRTLLHPLDYDHLGESSDEDEDTSYAALLGDGETDEAFLPATPDPGVAASRLNKRKMSDAGLYVPPSSEGKRKPKRLSSPALRHSSSSSSSTTTAVLTNHNAKTGPSGGTLDHTGRNNKKMEDTLLRLSHHNLAEHSEKMAAARRNVPVTISLKDINSMSLSQSVADNSEGRCSPLSEATDSAAEDDTTGDLLSSDGGRPDWTISATADSTGHCVMQVLRH